MTDLYENLLKATNNIDDITTEKYATVTKLNGNYCDAKEEDTGLEHTNVPIINGANLSVGDKAVIGFLNNSIYDVVCYGALDKTVHDDSKQDLLISGSNIKTINHQSLLGSGNITIEGGGDDGSTVWNTSTAPTYANSKYTFNISNLSGKTGLEIAVNDIIFYSTYYYIVSAVNTTTVDCSTRVSIKGSDASVTIQTSWGSTTSDSKVPSEKLVKNTIDGLSIPTKTSDLTNDGDGTNAFLTQHQSLSNYVQKSSTTGLLKNDGSVDTTAYSTFDGNYNSLTNKPTIPTIPTNVSAFTNDVGYLTQHQSLANYIQKSSTSGLIKNDGTVDTTSYLSSLPSHTHDDRYYTESEVDDALDDKQDLLVSGTNIKTINNTSLLGSGNITIGGGGSSVDIATSWGNPTSDSKVPSEKLTKTSLDDKISKSSTSGLVKNDGSIDTTSYSTFSGSYNDLTNKPSIPSKTSDLTNDSNFISKSSTNGLMKNDGTIDATTYVNTNDSRLSDARTPLSHTHTSSQVTDLIDVIYPVGSIYMSVNSTSPQTLFGGTWEQIKDTFLLASGDTYANGTTGGSADAVTVSHTHSFDRAYALTTDSTQGVDRNSSAGQTGTKVNNLLQSNGGAIYRNTINSTGESGTGKNMPPYLTVFVWKRTA